MPPRKKTSPTRRRSTPQAARRRGQATSRAPEQRLNRLVVKFRDDVDIPYTNGFEDKKELGSRFRELAERYGKRSLRRMFTSVAPVHIRMLSEQASKRDPEYGRRAPNLLKFFFLDLKRRADAREVMRDLRRHRKIIEYSYVDHPTDRPSPDCSVACAAGAGHLDPAPRGIHADFAKTTPGADGREQLLADVEDGWTAEHVRLPTARIYPAHGELQDGGRPHGTSVLGIACGAADGSGCRGIAPNVGDVLLSSCWEYVVSGNTVQLEENVYEAVLEAIFKLFVTTLGEPDHGPRCVLLLEKIEERRLKDSNKLVTCQLPLEAKAGIFVLLKLATTLGITVIEPAGNGKETEEEGQVGISLDVPGRVEPRRIAPEREEEDLDRFGFYPSDFDFGDGDSGAIMVGAGRSGPGHAPVSSSNYGSRVNCYAWGENIVTLTSSTAPSFSTDHCTGQFGKTSGASAIIAGVALAVQSFARNKAKAPGGLANPLTPKRLRTILGSSTYGTPCAPGPNIGVMPDLEAIIKGYPWPPPP
jgi:serine protease